MRKLVLAAVLVLVASGAQAVTLDVVGGILHGASGVLVDGSLYDVEFLDGTCIDLYNGCDDVSDFTFQTEASALLASQALLDQVFVDVLLGSFDSDPSLTAGCANGTRYCGSFTPYDFLSPCAPCMSVSMAANVTGLTGGPDAVYPSWLERGRDVNNDTLTDEEDQTYAVWQSTPIPEPSTALLLGLGLAGMAARRRV